MVTRPYWEKPTFCFTMVTLVMHRSFVTTAPKGLGNSEDFDFSLCKTRVYAQHWGEIFMVKTLSKALLKNLAGKCEITPAVLGMVSKAP